MGGDKFQPHERVSLGGSLHDNFVRQVQDMLAEEDLTDEERQTIMTNMSCPCCGGSASSLNIKLKD
jgi:hypothetical protein